MLRNIKYIGDNNLMYSIDNQKRKHTIKLSKKYRILNIFLGAYSKTDDMVLLTKEVILIQFIQKVKL
jgi:hypothetical protein